MAITPEQKKSPYAFDPEVVIKCELAIDEWLNRQPIHQPFYAVDLNAVPIIRNIRSLDMDELLRRYQCVGWEAECRMKSNDGMPNFGFKTEWSQIILRHRHPGATS